MTPLETTGMIITHITIGIVFGYLLIAVWRFIYDKFDEYWDN